MPVDPGRVAELRATLGLAPSGPDPARVAELKAALGGGPDPGRVAELRAAIGHPAQAPTSIDPAAYNVVRHVTGAPVAQVRAAAPEAIARISPVFESAVEKVLVPSSVAAADAVAPPLDTAGLQRSTFQKALDTLDVGFLLSGLDVVTRPVFTAASVVADHRALKRMSHADRDAFVASLPDDDVAKPAYTELVAAMKEDEDSRTFGDSILIKFEESPAVYKARDSLSAAYMVPFTNRDPYGGPARRPWQVGMDTPAGTRTPDAVDVLLRGFGLRDDDADAVKSKVGGVLASGIHGAGGALNIVMGAMVPGVVPGIGQIVMDPKALENLWSEPTDTDHLAADIVMNLVLLHGSGKLGGMIKGALPSAARAVETPMGYMTAAGDVTRAERVAEAQRIVIDAAEKSGAPMTPAAVSRLLSDTEAATHAALAHANDARGVALRRAEESLRAAEHRAALKLPGTDVQAAKRAVAEAALPATDFKPNVTFDADTGRVVWSAPETVAVPGGTPLFTAPSLVDRGFAVLGRIGNNELVAPITERARRLFGAGRHLAIADKSGDLRPVGVGEMVSEPVWQSVRALSRSRAGFEHVTKAEFSDLITEAFHAAPSDEARRAMLMLTEVMHEAPASEYAVAVEKVHRTLGDELEKALSLVERERPVLSEALKSRDAALGAAAQRRLATTEVEAARQASAASSSSAATAAESAVLARRGAVDVAKASDDQAAAIVRKIAEAKAAGSAVDPGLIAAAKKTRQATRVALADARKAVAEADSIAVEASRASKADGRALSAAEDARRHADAGADAAGAARAATLRAEQAAGSAPLVDPSESALSALLSAAVEVRLERAKVVSALMEEMTGAATPAAARDLAAARAAIDTAAMSVEAAAARVDAAEFARLTRGEVRQAERVFEREAKGLRVKQMWEALTPAQKKWVEKARATLDAQYDRMKAEGRLPKGMSKADMLDRTGVEYYAPHQLSRRGSARLAQVASRRGSLSTKIDATRRREMVGSMMEINREKIRSVARMSLEETGIDLATMKPDEATALLDEEAIRLGIQNLRFFETDAAEALSLYGQQGAKGLANTRYLRQVQEQFPEGKMLADSVGQRFTKAAITEADAQAEILGFRRVAGSVMLREAYPTLADWAGWKKHAGALDTLFTSGDDDAIKAVLDSLQDAGVPLTDRTQEAVARLVRNPIYVPKMIADEIEYLASPDVVQSLPPALRKTFGGAYTAVWKAAMTVLAVPFHVRNAMSNVVQSVLGEGVHVLRPSVQIKAISVLGAADDAMIRIGSRAATASEWRHEMREASVIRDLTDILDVGGAAKEARVSVPRAVVSGVGGAAAGSAAGAAAGDTPEEKFRYALAGALGGGLLGLVGQANFDMHARGALRVAREKRSAAAGFSQFLGDALDVKDPTGFMDGVKQWMENSRALPAGAASAAITSAMLAGTHGDIAVPAMATAATTAALAGVGEAGFAVAAGVGQAIENQARAAVWVAALERGATKQEAARVVDRVLMNYGDLTPFERYAMRRFMPFYTWNAKNVVNQAWLMVNRPERMQVLHKVITASMNNNDDASWMQPHFRNRWVIETARGRMVAGLATPIEAAMDFVGRPTAATLSGDPLRAAKFMASSSNPVALSLVEAMSDHSFYYDRDLSMVRSPRDVESLPGPIGDVLREWVGFRRVWDARTGKWVPEIGWYATASGAAGEDKYLAARRLAVLRAMPTSRLLGLAGAALNESMESAVSGPGERSGPASNLERMVGVGTGIKPYQVIIPTAADRFARRAAAVEQEMLRAGSAYQSIKVPKAPPVLDPVAP